MIFVFLELIIIEYVVFFNICIIRFYLVVYLFKIYVLMFINEVGFFIF